MVKLAAKSIKIDCQFTSNWQPIWGSLAANFTAFLRKKNEKQRKKNILHKKKNLRQRFGRGNTGLYAEKAGIFRRTLSIRAKVCTFTLPFGGIEERELWDEI